MPYSDRWNLGITKIGTGVYDVTNGTDTVRVILSQQFPTELINAGAALFAGIDELYANGRDTFEEPWRSRYDYALSRWKMAAYQALINAAPANQRPPLQAKRDVWVAKEAELKTRMGGDA